MAVLAAYIAWRLATHRRSRSSSRIVAVDRLVSLRRSARVIERYLMRRFERGDPDTAVVVTIGLLTLITGICGWIWALQQPAVPLAASPLETRRRSRGVSISVRSLGDLARDRRGRWSCCSCCSVGTKLGLAPARRRDQPAVRGVLRLPVGRLLMVGWGLAAVLGAVAGALVAPQLTLTPGMTRQRPRLRAGRRHPRRTRPARSASSSRRGCIGVLENLAARLRALHRPRPEGRRAVHPHLRRAHRATAGPVRPESRGAGVMAGPTALVRAAVRGRRAWSRSACCSWSLLVVLPLAAGGVRQPDARPHRRLRRRRARAERRDGLHRPGLARPDLLPRPRRLRHGVRRRRHGLEHRRSVFVLAVA